MTLGTVLVLIVAVGALAYVLAPLMRRDALDRDGARGSHLGELRELHARQQMLLASLKDLEDDRDTDKIYRACFASGLPAPVHLLDGLPDELVVARDAAGRVVAVKQSMIAGFVKEGVFYTRDEVCRVDQP